MTSTDITDMFGLTTMSLKTSENTEPPTDRWQTLEKLSRESILWSSQNWTAHEIWDMEEAEIEKKFINHITLEIMIF